MNYKKFFWYNIPIIYLLQMLDVHSTNIALKIGFTEGNPLMTYVVQYIWLAILVKIAITSLVMWMAYKTNNNICIIGVVILHNLMMFGVVGHNYFLIYKRLHGLD